MPERQLDQDESEIAIAQGKRLANITKQLQSNVMVDKQLPSQLYHKIRDKQLAKDPLQASIIKHFDTLWLLKPQEIIFRRKPVTHGIYLYGPVGRGKTMIIDTFLDSLPNTISYKRLHYHEFMRMIHHELRAIQGTPNPLITIAKKLAKQMQCLFLDEFCQWIWPIR